MLTRIHKKRLLSLTLINLLSCTTTIWIATTAIHPSVILAKALEFNLPIYRQENESYDQLLQRAENVAKSTIDSRLKQDPSLDEIKVLVVGENEGAIAPLLSVKVSRQAWKNEPQVKRWATYFTDSKLLLGFEQPEITPAKPPAAQQPSNSNQPPTAETPPSQTPQGEQPPQPEQVPLLEDPPQERQRNPLPVPTQRLRNAGNELPFVDPIDVEQLRPDLSNQ